MNIKIVTPMVNNCKVWEELFIKLLIVAKDINVMIFNIKIAKHIINNVIKGLFLNLGVKFLYILNSSLFSS